MIGGTARRPRAMFMAGNNNADTHGPELVDSRGVCKVEKFSGKREHFEEWIFPFESYCALLGWSRWVDAAREHRDEIVRIDLGEEAELVGRSMYHLLVSTVRGQALALVKLTERGHGLEAIRQLYKEYRSGLNEDHASMLTAILTPKWWKEREKHLFTEVFTQWDVLITQYELVSGEKVTSNMKTSTIISHGPETVVRMLRSCSREVRLDHAIMRKNIWEFVIGGNNTDVVPPNYDQSGTTAMEVDVIVKGKGKGGKGKGACHTCGKTGHYAAQCWSGQAGGKNAKGKKGGGKGNTKFAGKCRYCSNTGHKEADCNKKKKDEGGKAGSTVVIEEVPQTVSVIESAGGDDGDFWRMALMQDDDGKMTDENEKMSVDLEKMFVEHEEKYDELGKVFDEFEEKYDVLGKMVDELGEMFDDLLDETKARELKRSREEVAVPSVAMEPQCMAMPSEGHLVTLDSASDGHVAPSSYAVSCPRGSDAGPVLRDAQQAVIPFVGQAAVPMRVLGGQGKNFMKAKMRLGRRGAFWKSRSMRRHGVSPAPKVAKLPLPSP